MQTVLVANVRSFPLAFAAFLSRAVYFHLPPPRSLEKRTPGNKTSVTTRRRNKTSKGEVLFFCALAHFPSTSLSISFIGPEREVGPPWEVGALGDSGRER